MCSDPEQTLYPQRSICYVTSTRQAISRRVNAHFENAKPTAKNGWTHPMDGWTIWMSTQDQTPDDDFDGALPLD